ncbi:caspase domain-containing protein [Mycena olivaceomarginata]|nr:caspase domain-containing protein [Mycena olivaceomarginata]
MNGRPLDPATNQECELIAHPSARVDGQSYKALLIGIRGTKTQSEECPGLGGLRGDVEKIALLLTSTSYGYRDPDITILIDDGIAGHVQPTRANILTAIRNLVKGAKVGDHFFFHYCEHSMQIENRSNTEEDGMDECLIPTDGVHMHIVDNELNAALVLPLPSGCELVAVLDTCHSGSLLDLEHYKCNRVVVPWTCNGKKCSDDMRRAYGVARAGSRVASSLLPGRTAIPPSPAPSTRLLARRSEINMNLMCRPPPLCAPSIPPGPLGGGYAASRSAAGPQRTFTYRAGTFSSLPPLKETEAKNDAAKRWLRRLSCVPVLPCRSTRGVGTDTLMDDETGGVELPGTFYVLPEDQRCQSPVSMYACTGLCREPHQAAVDTEPSSGGVRAHVISLASCQDSELSYEDEDGNSMTSALVEILRRDPNQSLKDMLVSISHAMYTKALNRHVKAIEYKKNFKEFERRLAEHKKLNPKFISGTHKAAKVDLHDFQNPELSSAKPLDMGLRFRL